jgi:hypothetical protein
VESKNIQVFRFCRVPFGVISSPFLLGATIEAHLDTFSSAVADKLKGDIYVDNIITGAASEDAAIDLYQEAKGIFNQASMNLREWLSNSDEVNTCIAPEDRAESKEMQVLGHNWNSQSDTLSVKVTNRLTENEVPTKRSILKHVASVFDPMGLFAPVTLKGKLLLQELWANGFDWDNVIADIKLIQKWLSVESDISSIIQHQIPRHIHEVQGKTKKYRLLCFTDASASAYAASIYLHQEGELNSKANLLFAKTRLAPVKGMTIPRLELMAIVIGVSCLSFVRGQLQLPILEMILWTDSQVALCWIESDKNLPVFVKNRVCEIKSVESMHIRYINTKENPADVATRGTNPKALMENSLWWNGPIWLSDPSSTWSSQKELFHKDCDKNVEERTVPIASLIADDTKHEIVIQSGPYNIDIERYSSYTRLIRVTALVMKFIKKLQKQSTSDVFLTSTDLKDAENVWIKHVQTIHYSADSKKMKDLQKQLGLCRDDDGILHCIGRLENSLLSEGARQPILLPSKEKFTQLLIEKVHKEILHSGVSQTLTRIRQRFWITKGRSTVKATINQCSVCRRHEGGPYRMPTMSPLPSSRVTESRAFSRVGIDYLGPLQVKTNEDPIKVWICLFSCMVTRAIHLEVVLNMTTEEFLLAFKRFVSQRGTPVEVITDNGSQFRLASKAIQDVWKNIIQHDDVQSYFSTTGVNWHFIVELAPWMGGFYERLVGIVKRSLRKSLGQKLLTLIQMQTLVKEVEAVVNTRPLVYVDGDIDSNITLTPSHFLTLNPSIGVPEPNWDGKDPDYDKKGASSVELLKIWKKGQKLLNEFWRIWREDYLVSLRERLQVNLKAGRIVSPIVPQVGDIVLIKDNLPRGSWKVGRIIEILKSRDGEVRSANVVLPNKRVLRRPLNLLYPIESNCKSDYETTETASNDKKTEKIPTRQAANIAKKKIKDILCQ